MQHVPLARYTENLKRIIAMVRDKDSEQYSPETKIILMTPPPVIESRTNHRKPSVTKTYVEAVMRVGKEEGLPVANVHAAVLEAAGGPGDDELGPFL